ncbi:MAG: hypothetical protein P8Z71_09835 [Candidatus Sulfobium sp.]
MSKKLLQILKMLTKDLKDVEFYSEEMLNTFSYDEQELLDLGEELAEIETGRGMDEDELDILKSLLVYILIRKSSFEKEDIYSLVFGGGRRIIWN